MNLKNLEGGKSALTLRANKLGRNVVIHEEKVILCVCSNEIQLSFRKTSRSSRLRFWSFRKLTTCLNVEWHFSDSNVLLALLTKFSSISTIVFMFLPLTVLYKDFAKHTSNKTQRTFIFFVFLKKRSFNESSAVTCGL